MSVCAPLPTQTRGADAALIRGGEVSEAGVTDLTRSAGERAASRWDGRSASVQRSRRPALITRRPHGPGVWVSAATTVDEQPFLDDRRLGGEGALGTVLRAHAGVQQGHPSVGATLSRSVIKIDYALPGPTVGVGTGLPDGGEPHALLLRRGLG